MLETKELEPYSAEKLIFEVKKKYAELNKKEIFNEQSRLISIMNKIGGARSFSNFVPNYKTLATIAQIFDEKTPLNKKVLLETKILEHITGIYDLNTKDMKIKTSVVNSFAKIFNNTYKNLLEEQKFLLQKFIQGGTTGTEFKIYLNEELARLKKILAESLKNKEFAEDKKMKEKCSQVLEMLEEFKDTEVTKEMISKVLKVQNLAKEILS